MENGEVPEMLGGTISINIEHMVGRAELAVLTPCDFHIPSFRAEKTV
jgi:hypothetical protein